MPDDDKMSSIQNILERITKDKERVNDNFFLLSVTYDKISKKYNAISLSVLVMSAIVTLTEAVKMTILDFVNRKELDVDTELISFVVNILILTLGTVITVLSSIVKFKNYRDIMEKLRDNESILAVYKEKYNKKYDKVLNMITFEDLSDENLKNVYDKLTEYNNQIDNVNVLEHVRTDDIIRIKKYKAQFDIEMQRIEADKQVAISNYIVRPDGETVADNGISRLMSIEKIKRNLLCMRR